MYPHFWHINFVFPVELVVLPRPVLPVPVGVLGSVAAGFCVGGDAEVGFTAGVKPVEVGFGDA